MGKIDTGGAAFPSTAVAVTARDSSGEIARQMQATGVAGMTLRDWFAGRMIAYMALIDMERISVAKQCGEAIQIRPQEVAAMCYGYADAMIAHKRKTEAQQ